MHIAQLNLKPANSCIGVGSLLVQHQLRSSIEKHAPLVLAMTDLARTLQVAELQVKPGEAGISLDERELIRASSQLITSAVAILIIAANHEYAISRSADILKTVVEVVGSCLSKLCTDDLLKGITKHVLHENFVDLHEGFLAKQSAAELLCDFGQKLQGEIKVGIGRKRDYQVTTWSAEDFFSELRAFDYELKTIGEPALTCLEEEVIASKVFGKKPIRKSVKK